LSGFLIIFLERTLLFDYFKLKEKEMTFTERVQDSLSKGLEVSKELLIKARDKAKDFGDLGILKIEINHLENQAEKVLGQLGSYVFDAVSEKNLPTIDANDEDLKKMVDEIEELKSSIEEKEKKIKELQGKK
jgi:chromosome segregation ATPase